MQVKCPKCKYKFDEDIPAYVHEASCVCPRCGTPFFYVLQVDGDDEQAGEAPQGDYTDSEAAPAEEQSEEITALPKSEATANESAKRPLRDTKVASYRQRRSFVARQDSHRERFQHQGKMRALGCLAIVVVALIVIIPSITGWNKTRTYDSSAASETKPAAVEEEADTLENLFDTMDDVPAEKAPAWIEGEWVAHTEYYDIHLYIYDGKVTEIDNDYQANGTYTYKRGKLVCDYGHNNFFIYNVDTESKHIDCGDGITMSKVK